MFTKPWPYTPVRDTTDILGTSIPATPVAVIEFKVISNEGTRIPACPVAYEPDNVTETEGVKVPANPDADVPVKVKDIDEVKEFATAVAIALSNFFVEMVPVVAVANIPDKIPITLGVRVPIVAVADTPLKEILREILRDDAIAVPATPDRIALTLGVKVPATPVANILPTDNPLKVPGVPVPETPDNIALTLGVRDPAVPVEATPVRVLLIPSTTIPPRGALPRGLNPNMA